MMQYTNFVTSDKVLNEIRQVIRDPLLKWVMLCPLLITLVFRFAIPWVNAWAANVFGFEISPYYPLMMSLLPALVPSIIGMVVGFALLDMKDDGSLSALQVTPLGLAGYLKFKLSIPMIISLPVTALCLYFSDLQPFTAGELIIASLSAAILAPVFTLLLVGFAENKVQGFALTKFINAIILPPVLAWFFPAIWNWAFGILPTWWPMKGYWLLGDDLLVASAIIFAGWVIQGIWILLLWRKVVRNVA